MRLSQCACQMASCSRQTWLRRSRYFWDPVKATSQQYWGGTSTASNAILGQVSPPKSPGVIKSIKRKACQARLRRFSAITRPATYVGERPQTQVVGCTWYSTAQPSCKAHHDMHADAAWDIPAMMMI